MARRTREGLYQRGPKKIWYVQRRNKRISLGTSDKEIALKKLRAIELAEADPYTSTDEGATLKEAVAALLENKARFRPASVGMYKIKAGHLLRVFKEAEGDEPGRVQLASIPRRVPEYVAARLDEEAATTTIGKELTALHQCLKLAKQQGKYAGPTSGLAPMGFNVVYTPKERVLSPAEEKKLEAKCTPEEWGTICAFLGTAGRASEVMRLRPEDIDWERRVALIRGSKTPGSRDWIPIVDKGGMASYLRQAEKWLPIKTEKTHRWIGYRAKAAGIEPLSCNDLRRTTLSRLREAGVDTPSLARIARHASLAMVYRVYDRAKPEELRRQIDGIGTKPVQVSGKRSKKSAGGSANS